MYTEPRCWAVEAGVQGRDFEANLTRTTRLVVKAVQARSPWPELRAEPEHRATGVCTIYRARDAWSSCLEREGEVGKRGSMKRCSPACRRQHPMPTA